ncbi:carbohydrate kinase family protein [Paenibacillus roseipurpureus]|uniref:Carbohydrate kinase family protein n=1 Tax=Paenibacillus roseopurpureus TaxID=2918901 RepID=A0AA96LQB1_9BACL|nr:carbohydrate kinase family protein [Paenibacillus sp. MBLB1832]WNR45357.1 carbohydrate kinase family protein [Paenibacillus sp. MBLB1832]
MVNVDVLVCGPIFTDIVFSNVPRMPKPGEEVYGQGFEFTCGGSTYITSVAMARLGMKIAVAAPLGNDFLSQFTKDQLQREGLTADYSYIVDRPMRQVTAAINTEGDRAFVTFQDQLDEAGYQQHLLALLDTMDASMLIVNAKPEFVPVIEKARSKGMSIVLDIGWDDEWIYSRALKQLLQLGHYFTPNLAEALAITGKSTAEEALDVLCGIVETPIVKLGAAGAIYPTVEGVGRIVGKPVESPVDTTGAGDNFLAGVLTGVLKGWGLEEAIQLGNYCGGQSVLGIGGTAASPTWEQVKTEFIHQLGGDGR